MKIKKTTFKIIGMHCVSCAMSIDFDLEEVEGVKKAQTSYAGQVCEVEFDEEKTKIENLFKTIEKTGYKAQLKK